jgi:hypothetical protein
MPLSERDALLVELMLQAELFCSQIERLGKKKLPLSEVHALLLKISQCRGALTQLQAKFENDELTIEDPLVCADFRTLVMSLLWVHFFARKFTDFKLFRRLVQIESGFTYLLAGRKNRSDGTGEPQ